MTRPPSPLLAAASVIRNGVLNQDRAVAVRLLQAYAAAHRRLTGDIEALAAAIAELGPAATPGQVARLTLYRNLEESIREQIGRYAIIAENEIDLATQGMIAAALRDSRRLIAASLPGLNQARLAGLLVRLNPDQVTTMLSFLQNDSPLYVNLRKLGDDVAALVASKLQQGLILGINPRQVAREISKATGQDLTWSLNTARTANLYTYRLTNHANYAANSHVVKSWQWWAQLGDKRTCLSCISQHGSVHGHDQVLNDHHAGRCAPLPVTVSYKEMGFNVPDDRPPIQRGEAWFRGLSAAEQRDRMGAASWRAWRAGAIRFEDLSRPYSSEVYGEMLREASLRDLLGERARAYYAR